MINHDCVFTTTNDAGEIHNLIIPLFLYFYFVFVRHVRMRAHVTEQELRQSRSQGLLGNGDEIGAEGFNVAMPVTIL